MDNQKQHSIEVYDEKLGRNTYLTRSARMRKFKFYQFKPVHDTSPKTPTTTNNKIDSDSVISSPILKPRDEVIQGKVPLVAELYKEVSELDDQIKELERRIEALTNKETIKRQDRSKGSVAYLDEIFDLVIEKNDLLRRQMQLNILNQERALEKANEELTKELRSLISIDDSRKSPAQLQRQQYLYDQSLSLVNRRNELVLHMDVQEKGIEDDEEMKAKLKSAISDTSTRGRLAGRDQNCCIQ